MSGRQTRDQMAIISRPLVSDSRMNRVTLDFIKDFRGDPNYTVGGRTALANFSYFGHADLIDAIMKKGALVRIDNSESPVTHDALSIGISRNKVNACLVMIDNCDNAQLRAKLKGQTYLHQAVHHGVPEVCRRLVERLTRDDALVKDDYTQRTPLELARHCWWKPQHANMLAQLEGILGPERTADASQEGAEDGSAAPTEGAIENAEPTANIGTPAVERGASTDASGEGGSSSGLERIPPVPLEPAVPHAWKRIETMREERGHEEPPAKKSKGKSPEVSGGVGAVVDAGLMRGSIESRASLSIEVGGSSSDNANPAVRNLFPEGSLSLTAVPSNTKKRERESGGEEQTKKSSKGKAAAVPVWDVEYACRRESIESKVSKSEGGGSSGNHTPVAQKISMKHGSVVGSSVAKKCKNDNSNLVIIDSSDSEAEPVVTHTGRGALPSQRADLSREVVMKMEPGTLAAKGGSSSPASARNVEKNTKSTSNVNIHSVDSANTQCVDRGRSVVDNTSSVVEGVSRANTETSGVNNKQVARREVNSGHAGGSTAAGARNAEKNVHTENMQTVNNVNIQSVGSGSIAVKNRQVVENNNADASGASAARNNVDTYNLANAKLAIAQKRHAERTADVSKLSETLRIHEEGVKSCADRVARAQKHVEEATRAAHVALQALLGDTANSQLEDNVSLADERLEVARVTFNAVKKALTSREVKLRDVRDVCAVAAKKLEGARADAEAAEKQVQSAD